MENKTICLYPWNGGAVRTDGRLVPCCIYTDKIGNNNHYIWSSDARDSEHWKEIRSRMLSGEPVAGCFQCYDNEKFGKKSMREWSIQLGKQIPTDNKVLPIRDLEVVFSNLCNLACASCNMTFSSKWASEDIKAGRMPKQHIQLESNFDFKNWDLSELTRLKIIGGEPFMEQKRFIELLNQINLPNTILSVYTNGTTLPNETLKLQLESAKHVWFAVSIDAIASTNDWYRWPSKFSEIRKTLDTYNKWWGDNKKFLLNIHCVVSAINIFQLQEFVEFFEKNYPNWLLDFDWLVGPNWQTIESLPESVKIKLIEEFKTAIPPVYSKDGMDPFKYSIGRLQETPKVLWEEMKQKITSMSKERNLDFFEMVPHFKNIWDIEE